MKKGQFNFVLFFAIVAGGAILFLAIFGALKTGETEKYREDTEIAKSISILTDPLQAGFAEGSFGRIRFSQETRINNFCASDGEFGENKISVSTRSRIGQEWNIAGGAISIKNKYIFSSDRSSGSDYYVFSKRFEFPYKVADLIFLTSNNYCFVDAPDEIVRDVSSFNMPNVQAENCTLSEFVKVCFESGVDCDVRVYGDLDEGTVEKYGSSMKYVDNLMYAAIFSDKGIYDCNVERLLYRTGRIAEEFSEKTDLMDARNCNSNLKVDLLLWKGSVMNASVNGIFSLREAAGVLDKQNERELCGVW